MKTSQEGASRQQAIDQLREELKGSVLASVTVHVTDDRASVQSTEAISKGTVIATVPQTLSLEGSSEPKEEVRQLAEAMVQACKGFPSALLDNGGVSQHVIAIARLALMMKDDANNLHVATMPRSPPSLPSLWPADVEVDRLLDATAVGPLVAHDRVKLHRMVSDPTVQHLLGEHAAELLARAVGVVNSRAVPNTEKAPTLVPFVDLFRAETSEHANCAVRVEQVDGEAAFQVVTSSDVAPNEELCLSFGPCASSFFLYRFGSVPGRTEEAGSATQSAHDMVAMRVADLSDLQRRAAESVMGRSALPARFQDVAQAEDAAASAMLGSRPYVLTRNDTGTTANDILGLSAIACTKEEAHLQRMVSEGQVFVPHGSLNKEDLGRKALMLLASELHMRQELAKEGAPEGGNAQMVLRVVLGEKVVLEAWMQSIIKMLAMDEYHVKDALDEAQFQAQYRK